MEHTIRFYRSARDQMQLASRILTLALKDDKQKSIFIRGSISKSL